jgi:GT2 family glycosyltransferase
MELSIIFVNWNAIDYLQECIASVYEYTSALSFEIIVVDNASPAGGLDRLRQRFPNITIIENEGNLGFAGANNVGFGHSCGKYLLFLNPDTKLIGPAINIMVREMESLPDAGIVGCKILNEDHSVQLAAIQKFPTILNQLLDVEYLQLRWPHCSLWNLAPLFSDDIKVARVEVISGACMLVRREVFEKVQMFSEDYFMYAEDIDLNYKVNRAGFSNYYIGEAAVVHYGGRSSSRQEVSHWATLMKYRAMRRLFGKTRGEYYGRTYRALIGFAAICRLALLAIAFLFANVFWDRESIRIATDKWRVILKWAFAGKEACSTLPTCG